MNLCIFNCFQSSYSLLMYMTMYFPGVLIRNKVPMSSIMLGGKTQNTDIQITCKYSYFSIDHRLLHEKSPFLKATEMYSIRTSSIVEAKSCIVAR